MGILMKNGVSYSAPYAGYTKTLKEKLVAGETSVTFVDNCITDNVTVDWEVSKFGLVPTDKIEGNHSLTFVFPVQQEDIWVKATFTSTSSNSEVPSNKMVFLKATGAQYIELSDVRGNEGIKLEFYGYLADYTGGSQGIFGTQWARDCLCVTNSIPSGGTIGIEWERQGATDLLTVPCNKPVHFVFDTNGELRADEQVITFTPTTYTNKTIKLFCGGDNGGYKGNLWASEMKIYKNNVLVKDLIPTKVNGVPCYYDVIGRKPYFSATSTPFQLEEIEYEPPVKPEFKVEYEMTNASTSTDTFTVVNEGLYFLSAVNSVRANYLPTITINSASGQIWNSNNTNAVCAYCFATLYPGDTVVFGGGGLSYRGNLYQAIRITNMEFSSLDTYEGQAERHNFTYNILNIKGPTFIYYGQTGASSAYDTSNINATVCNTYTRRSTDGKACSRIVTCNDAGNGGTITGISADYDCDLFIIAKLTQI